ncbi:succinate dehydrogenase/fumarate reductase transmembrane subunit [Desulfovibrio sp. 86]|uniref:Fumarate reductase respiratory complex transmembrane subunit n=1 Tax=uncultured Desulfovibrio sp. TaxID=167968 RepID=A0A212LA13_9BACT|nr:succinate dehydrogenase/fumarate reductase transmembrane subunit [Desulfovibrio sp. 86]SCM74376.1 Fumarate reductase respiratory complex transmembrane subunit [uncultured Desulfovibrio sp.]VZH34797.1 Fumarate reductase respiratory complex transmembrane subunit [Desulfovibrio sp. 86]
MALSRNSAEGKTRLDFWQAATGAFLALFVCVHLLLEGTVVISPALTNGIAWFLEATWLTHLVAPIIILMVVFHFYIAARKMPFRAHELGIFVRHSKSLKDFDTWLWLVQVFTAIAILLGVFFHVYAIMTDLPINVAGSAKRLHSGWLAFYVVFLPCVILHTGIGVYRLAVKYGVCVKSAKDMCRKWIWIVMGCYLLLGSLALARVWFQG